MVGISKKILIISLFFFMMNEENYRHLLFKRKRNSPNKIFVYCITNLVKGLSALVF